jgi:hypothetical protein
MRIPVGLFLVIAVSVSLCSCGPKGPARQKTFRVTGKVTVDGKPVAHLRVFANPKDKGDPKYPILPQAATQEDGSFQLYSYEPGDGVPSGEYAMTFTWQELRGFIYDGPDKLKNRYADPAKSTIKLTVEKGPADLGTIALTTK